MGSDTVRPEPGLTARLLLRTQLHYADGADATLDRPRHVRAGSSVAWFAGRLAIIQDDANFLVLTDPEGTVVEAVSLPAGPGGMRQFDDRRGNKRDRLDLEACVAIGTGNPSILLAFGSGSSRRREHVLLVENGNQAGLAVSVIQASRLYAMLRAESGFAGSELNLEGVIQTGDQVRFFSRGNGAARRGRLPANASCDLPVEALLEHLRAPDRVPAPAPLEVRQYHLGRLGGVPLGFTDAAWIGDQLYYSAAAEASPDATRDGKVAGSAIGTIDSTGAVRWAPITDAGGNALAIKIEGLVPSQDSAAELLVVVDSDDPETPSELCRVALSGPWAQGAAGIESSSVPSSS